ncbi:MAG TPA: porin family protein [Rhodothermales bacterium]|nr:porin family protein [Rhodothermales bacterium]
MSFFGVLPVAAQEYVAAIKMGVAVTNFSGETDASLDPHAGLTGGAAIGYDFGNGFLLQPEILYVRKGAYADTELEFTDLEGNPIANTPVRARFDLTYLEVPLLAVYRFEGRSLEPKLFAGPYVAYKLNAVVEYRALAGGPTQSEEDDSVENFDYGAIAGVGTDFFIEAQRFSIDARAIFGQGNVRQADPPLKLVGGVLMIGIVF